jgi:hypothetical protein
LAVQIVTIVSANEQPPLITSHSQRSLPQFLGISGHKLMISASTEPATNTELMLHVLPGETRVTLQAEHFCDVEEYC